MALTGTASALEAIVVRVEPVARAAAGIGVLALMFLTVADIVTRTVAGGGVAGIIEITEVALVIVVYLGLMTAGRDGHHIRVGLLTDRLPAPAARVLRLLGLAIALFLVAWVIWVTAGKAVTSIEMQEFRFGLIGVPIWPARLAIPIGLSGLLLVFLLQFVALLAGYRTTVGREREPFEELLDTPES